MPIFGDPLVPTAPGGPGQDTLHALLGRQHETPEETTNLADTQRHNRPREALKTVRLLPEAPCEIFFHGGAVGRGAARNTVNSAYAHMANVLCRYQPVQGRTSSCSSPPSPLASSQHRSMVQRRPTTWTTVARGVVSGAHTPDAVRSVGALRLRRTKSPRRQWGCKGAAKGSHRPSYPRGPVGPSPACHRPPSSSSTSARSVVTGHWRPARPTYACPETVRTYAWGRSSHHARRWR